MKTYYWISLLIIVLLYSSCKKEDAQPEVTLVMNGNFEQKLQNWAIGDNPSDQNNNSVYDMGYTDEAASSPKYSIKISCNEIKNDSAFSYFVQSNISTRNIAVGAKLTLKAKIKTVNLEGNGVSIAIRGDNKGSLVFFTTSEGKTPILGTKDFTEYSMVLNSYPVGIDNLMIFLVYLPETTGTAFFDDVTLVTN